jgi:hypothetical protein
LGSRFIHLSSKQFAHWFSIDQRTDCSNMYPITSLKQLNDCNPVTSRDDSSSLNSFMSGENDCIWEFIDSMSPFRAQVQLLSQGVVNHRAWSILGISTTSIARGRPWFRPLECICETWKWFHRICLSASGRNGTEAIDSPLSDV